MSQRQKSKPTEKATPPARSVENNREASAPPPRSGSPSGPWSTVIVCLALTMGVWAIYGQTLWHEYVNFDDNEYIYDSPIIISGLSFGNVIWAFTHVHAYNWHPLTTMSHMLDCQIYGLNPAGHHLGNLLLHNATAMLLFIALRSMTGQFWPSAFVAALFAFHPLRVESVAWISERKDVLSGLFFVLALGAYARYSRRANAAAADAIPIPGWRRCLASPDYYMALLFAALGLLSKPMLVTLPCVLLLLDYWPLNRWNNFRSLLMEKIPFLLLSLSASGATVLAQKSVIEAASIIPVSGRVGNAFIAYATYVKQVFLPTDLAIFYPHPGRHLTAGLITVAVVLLGVLSAIAFALRRRSPFLGVGWLWFLGMLVPVIGLVQVGNQGHADRYTYLPHIGLYVMLTWAVWQFSVKWRYRNLVLGATATAMLFLAGSSAYFQSRHWRNSISLWTHALECTADNFLPRFNLAAALAGQSQFDAAVKNYRRALQFQPHHAPAQFLLGAVLATREKFTEAIPHYERALQIKADYPEAHNHLGIALAAQGQLEEAIRHYGLALKSQPNYADANYNLGIALARQGKLEEAVQRYQRVLQIQPRGADTHYNLGNALSRQGKPEEAVKHYKQALEMQPRKPETHYNLGIALAALSKPEEAIQHFRFAAQFKPGYAEAHNNLGILLAKQMKWDEAVPHFQEALKLAIAQSNQPLADSIRARLRAQK